MLGKAQATINAQTKYQIVGSLQIFEICKIRHNMSKNAHEFSYLAKFTPELVHKFAIKFINIEP